MPAADTGSTKRSRRVVKRILGRDLTTVPADLADRLRKYLEKYPATAWDDALAELAANGK